MMRVLRLCLSFAPSGLPRTAHVTRPGSAAHRSFAALRAASLLLIAIRLIVPHYLFSPYRIILLQSTNALF